MWLFSREAPELALVAIVASAECGAARASGLDARAGCGVAAGVRYIGGKNGDGTFQRIINLIPPHRVYIEPFLGSGAILRHKRPAAHSYGVDLALAPIPALVDRQDVTLLQQDGIAFLESYQWRGDEFIYADPPYLLSTRGGRRYYAHELEDPGHRRLLAAAVKIPAKMMISGYDSPMYNAALVGWRRVEFTAYTRQHQKRTEVLWMNYDPPAVLHDHQHVGGNYRDRWRIEKRRRRWVARMKRLAPLERSALYVALVDVMAELQEMPPPRGAPVSARPLTLGTALLPAAAPQRALPDLDRSGSASSGVAGLARAPAPEAARPARG